MTVSPLANMAMDIPAGNRYNQRGTAIVGVTIHHNAGVNAYGEATNPGREVSANYWISNNGDIIPQVDEEYRAWTSGTAGYPAGAESDHRNITFEVSNSPEGVANRSWAISAAAEKALSNLIGDIFKRYGLGPVVRGTYGGVAVHRDFVPTACPGPYIMDNLGRIISNAEKYRVGGASSGGSSSSNKKWKAGPVSSYTPTKENRQKLDPGKYTRVYINEKKEFTIASGAGLHLAKGQVNFSGKAGDTVEVTLGIDTCKPDGTRVGEPQYIAAETVILGAGGVGKRGVFQEQNLPARTDGLDDRIRIFVKPLDGPVSVTFVRGNDAKLN